MKESRHMMCVMMITALIFVMFSGCKKSSGELSASPIENITFRDIPGVTQDEINAIEALKEKYDSFVCAIYPNTDSFINKDGGIDGFAILFYDWLSGFMGIPFKPMFYEWNDLLRGLEAGEIDFTCELADTPEHRKSYFLTGGIAQRQLKIYRIAGSEALENIINSRRPRYAFLAETALAADFDVNTGYDFEAIFVNSHEAAYPLLESGVIDAYIGMDTTEAVFDVYGSVVGEDFFPLVFRSSCLLTPKAELRPVISVMEKALDARVLRFLAGLHKAGYQKYLENKLYMQLTEEERSYIKNNPVVPIGAEFSNYPLSFFDTHTNQWDGIFFDALQEITKLTGINFQRINGHNVIPTDLVKMLELGEVLILPELFDTEEYKNRFLRSEIPLIKDDFVFITRSDFRSIEINEVSYLITALNRNSIYSELFKKMFPGGSNFIEYNTMEETWDALKRGDADAIFTSRRRLLIYTNYYEDTSFKLNLLFDHSFDTTFGYNRDAAVLRSIVDKALRLINVHNISNRWMYKSYDYRQKLTEAQRPWLFGSSILLVFTLALTVFFLMRSRSTGKQLEKLVKSRTIELERETMTLKTIFDASADFIFCKDLNSLITRCNRSIEKYFNFNEKEMIGKNDMEVFGYTKEIMEELIHNDKMIIEERRPVIFEGELPSVSGSDRIQFIETVKTPLIQDGEVVGILAIARDITHRKMIEKELALQTSLLKTMISALPDAVFCKDLNFKYTLCNKYMADIFDKNFEDILGKDDVTALGLPAETAALANDVDRRVINERLRVVYEEWICGADGVNRLFETVKTPLMQDGVLIGLLGIGRDITQRKAMEEEVRAASFAKTAFLANMSHEIRTPLNVVIGLTDMVLEENNLSAHVSENLIKINNAGSTLLSIVNDLLDFSKIESGKLTLIPGEYHMSSMLNDVITIVTTSLGEKPISFSLNISDDLPGRLYGDDLRVKQIFNNLLSNAIKYTHRGSIELRVNCTRESEDWRMEISVSDTGIGIRDGDIKKLFHDYYQADLRSNRNITGTGLGLSITMRLVQMMGGEISVESEYGSGSAFHVYVRQGFVDDTPIGPAVANNLRSFHYADDKRIATKRLIRLNLSYAKVLVVDDMQTNLDVSVGLLRKYKMQVDCLSSGQEALERIRGGFPVYNAIFMDHMMPGMDGIETTDAIRALDTEYARKVPIIALTANAIYGTEEMFYEHGFQAFISKPIDIMELDSIVRKWVQDKSQEAKTSDPDISVTDEDAKDENTAIVIPGVDVEKGLSLYSGDKDLYLLLLRSYVSNVPETLIKLGSVSKETLSNYVITVHGLKGTSAAIGAELIREEALNLETMSRAGDLNGVLTLNGRLISNTTVVVDNIKNWLEKYDAAAAKPRLRAPDPETLARLRQSCENFDMVGIDKALSELESVDYEEDADLITWLKEKIGTSEITAVAQRLLKYGEKPEK